MKMDNTRPLIRRLNERIITRADFPRRSRPHLGMRLRRFPFSIPKIIAIRIIAYREANGNAIRHLDRYSKTDPRIRAPYYFRVFQAWLRTRVRECVWENDRNFARLRTRHLKLNVQFNSPVCLKDIFTAAAAKIAVIWECHYNQSIHASDYCKDSLS